MDWQVVQPFFTWLGDNPGWAGLVVLIIALTESLVIVGLIVPGAVLMFGVGTLVGAGVLGFKETILLAFIGAVLGDSISFWVGKHYHEQLARCWPFNKRPDYLELGKFFFTKHGGKSIFIGRFVGPVRPIIPAVAGMMGMSPRYFIAMNVLSACLWAPFYLIPGVVFGKSIALAEVVGGRLMVILLVFIVLLILVIWLVRKLVLIALPRAESVFSLGFQWAVNHPVLGQAILSVFDPRISMRRALVISAGLILLILLAFYLLMLQLFQSNQLGIDEFAINFSSIIQSPALDEFFRPISLLFSFSFIGVLVVFVSLVLLRIKEFSVLRYLLFSIAVSVVTAAILLFSSNAQESQFSSVLYLVVMVSFVGCCTIISFSNFKFSIRWVAYAVLILLLFFPVLSLFYFASATLSTVLMVIATSFVWLGFISLIYQQQLVLFKKQKLFGVFTVSLLIMVGIINNNFAEYHSVENIVKLKTDESASTFENWQANDWKQIPVKRVDIFGEQKQALNIQWNGELAAITNSLKLKGWETPIDLTTQAVMYYLKPEPTFSELPLIPQSHNGKQEALVLYKVTEDSNQHYVLQFWKAALSLSDTGGELWVGSLTLRTLSIHRKWIRYPQLRLDDSISDNVLQPLAETWSIRQLKNENAQSLYLLSEQQYDEK